MLPMTLLENQHYPMNGKQTQERSSSMIQFQQIQIFLLHMITSFIHAVVLQNAGGEVEFTVILKIPTDASSASRLSTSLGGNVPLQVSKPLEKAKHNFELVVILLKKPISQNAESLCLEIQIGFISTCDHRIMGDSLFLTSHFHHPTSELMQFAIIVEQMFHTVIQDANDAHSCFAFHLYVS